MAEVAEETTVTTIHRHHMIPSRRTNQKLQSKRPHTELTAPEMRDSLRRKVNDKVMVRGVQASGQEPLQVSALNVTSADCHQRTDICTFLL